VNSGAYFFAADELAAASSVTRIAAEDHALVGDENAAAFPSRPSPSWT
jgi:hypothetical protein